MKRTLFKAVQPMRRSVGKVVRRSVGNLISVDTAEPLVALTFDDGPDPVYTPQLLKVLARHRCHATFFMVGENVLLHPTIVEEVMKAGHAIGNHSWDHPSFPLISARERRRQIRRCETALEPYGGVKLFRPPYGHQSFVSRVDAFRLGYTVVLWDVVISDWLNEDALCLAERLTRNIKPGSIVCLHDRVYGNVANGALYDRGPMIQAVEMALRKLSGRMRFVTVPELLEQGKPILSLSYEPPPRELLPRLREHPLVQKDMRYSSANAS
jgi:peptidoglycan/xylan/chitin deacetylase (PgdA/CDA1 family)